MGLISRVSSRTYRKAMTGIDYPTTIPKFKHATIPEHLIWYPASQLICFTADYVVTVIDDKNEKRYIPMHKEILKLNVGYFKAIFEERANWVEQQNGVTI